MPEVVQGGEQKVGPGAKASKKKKQQLYMIAGGGLLLLIVILFSVKKSKDNAAASTTAPVQTPAGQPYNGDTDLAGDSGDDFGGGGGGGGGYSGNEGNPWDNNWGPGNYTPGSQIAQEEMDRWQQSYHHPYRGAPPYSVYHAQEGDTMSGIGMKYGVDSRAMSRANGGSRSVSPGQSVNVPHGAGA